MCGFTRAFQAAGRLRDDSSLTTFQTISPPRARAGQFAPVGVLGSRQAAAQGSRCYFLFQRLFCDEEGNNLSRFSHTASQSLPSRTSDQFALVPSGHCCPLLSAIRRCRHCGRSLLGRWSLPPSRCWCQPLVLPATHILGFALRPPPRLLRTPSSWLLMGRSPGSALRCPPHPRTPRADPAGPASPEHQP